MLQYLYALTIGPIEQVFKIIFSVLNKYVPVSGVCILLLSLVFSLIVLPLYMRADKIQEEAKEDEERLGPTIKHIKQYFKGDERFMILQTYYRQNNYSPLGVLRSSVSLLLQVPFFLAAYRMLHNNVYLQGKGFGPIADLNAPDALLNIGGTAINVLPFVMTAINLVSAAIYANKMPLKSKIQLWVMAALFLVLLYNSPSGMVIYWTCNNLFSLIKNVINRIVSSKKKAAKPVASTEKLDSRYKAVFYFSCLTCAVYLGFYLPMNMISSAAEEFVNLYTMASPMLDVLYAVCKGFGLFLLWPAIFYAMASVRGKKILSYVMFMLATSSILNSKIFSNDFGDLSNFLKYKTNHDFTRNAIIWSLVVTVVACVICFLIVRFGKNIAPVICFSAALVFAVLGIAGIGKVNEGHRDACKSATSKAEITLSKTGKNVIVIMADRAVGPMLPYIFNEKPELKKAYDGFVYYHNTVSLAAHTNAGIPGIIGGYEYSPEEMNKRTDKLISEKLDEAHKVLPTIFNQNGFDTTIINPSYAGYKWYPDLSIYNGMENLKAYSTKFAYLPEDLKEGYSNEFTDCFRYNLFAYSIYKSAPVLFQEALYDDGNYNETRIIDPSRLVDQKRTGTSKSEGHSQAFIWDYYTMKAMSDMTKVEENGNHYVYFGTHLTHDTQFLQEPSYEPSDVVNNSKYDKSAQGQARFLLKGQMMWVRDAMDYRHYQCNVANYELLAKWFEYLKANGCYDNTKIIIVSDHGFHLENFTDIINYEMGMKLDGEAYTPILMVKDFGSHGEIQTSEEFMTNADTPYLALKGVVDNPVNPFTGKAITVDGKANGAIIYRSDHWNPWNNTGPVYASGDWISVKDNLWKIENWKYLGTH